MSGDIVERLREYAHIVQSDRYDDGELLEEAADEIVRLRAAGDRLAAAVNAVACSGPRDEMAELVAAYIDWEARRG